MMAERRARGASRPRGLRILVLVTAALLLTATLAQAAEMVVQGQVVRVVPLASPGADCRPAKPAPGAGLIELLHWDLRAECPPGSGSGTRGGYQVDYRWDGRTYSRIMDEPPGDTISLRVRIR